MFEKQAYDLLIVSDLHLSEGRNPESKKVSLNEDFFFDEEFSRFLEYHAHRTRERAPERKWHLIINGDFLDFLQVICPISEDADRDFLEYLGVKTAAEAMEVLRYDRKHPCYGLGSGAKETVYKLWKIMNGHWMFFEAIAEFVAEGNVVTVGRGNHDVELVYPEVRGQFIPRLRRMYLEKLEREQAPDRSRKILRFDEACALGHIRFSDWFYYEPGLLWVEHGNQYDKLNSFQYWLAPFLPKTKRVDVARQDEIDLPWGSFFVRYLFNRVESKEPFADNIKPQSRFIRWFLTVHPGIALGFLVRDGCYMLSKMARAWRSVPEAAYAARKAAHDLRLEELAQEEQIDRDVLRKLDTAGFRDPSVLREPDGSWCIYKILTRWWWISLPVIGLLLLTALIGLFWMVGHVLGPVVPAQVRLMWGWLGTQMAQLQYWRQFLEGLRWPAFVFSVLLIVGYLWSRFTPTTSEQPSALAGRAAAIRNLLKVRFVTMGHTHETDLKVIGNDAEYFNTGTWTKVFGDDKDRLLHEESELVFLEVVRQENETKVRLMKWEDGAGEPRLVMLFTEEPCGPVASLPGAAPTSQQGAGNE